MLKALLFDLDGTMADTDPLHFLTWQAVMQEHGIEIDEAFYKARFSGRLNIQIVQDHLPHLSYEAGIRLSDYKEAAFRDRARTVLQPLPGLLDIIAWTDQHHLKRAAVTNAPRLNAEFMLDVLGVRDRFPLVVLGDELPKGKPDPLPYQTALNQLGVTAAETIAFEDSPSGVRSAVGANIPTVAIATTHDPDTLYQLGAVLVVDDFTDPRLQTLLRRPAETLSDELTQTPGKA